MARTNRSYRIQVHHHNALAAASQKLYRSRSSIVNEALKTAANNTAQVIQALLNHTPNTATEHTVNSFVTDPAVDDAAEAQANKLHLSRNHFLRLALDYFFLTLANDVQNLDATSNATSSDPS